MAVEQRPWDTPYKHTSLPELSQDGSWCIHYVRDFSEQKETAQQEWRTYVRRPEDVIGGWFYVMKLSKFGVAQHLFSHTCLGFSFADGFELIYSLEVRLHKGESFNPLGTQELTHLFTTNDDMTDFRRVRRGKEIERYPLTIAPHVVGKILVASLQTTADVANVPSLNKYNLLSNQCTSALFAIMNKGLETKIPPHPFWYLTTFSPLLLAKNGIIDTNKKEIV